MEDRSNALAEPEVGVSVNWHCEGTHDACATATTTAATARKATVRAMMLARGKEMDGRKSQRGVGGGNECGTRDWHGSGKWPRRFSSDHHVLPPCPRNLRSLGIVSTFAASTSSNCFATCSTWALGTAATCAPGHKNMKRGCIGRPAIASEVARACREYVTPICCWRWRWCWCCIR